MSNSLSLINGVNASKPEHCEGNLVISWGLKNCSCHFDTSNWDLWRCHSANLTGLSGGCLPKKSQEKAKLHATFVFSFEVVKFGQFVRPDKSAATIEGRAIGLHSTGSLLHKTTTSSKQLKPPAKAQILVQCFLGEHPASLTSSCALISQGIIAMVYCCWICNPYLVRTKKVIQGSYKNYQTHFNNNIRNK